VHRTAPSGAIASTGRHDEFRTFEGHAMCGIVGVVSHSPVNQLIYDSLLLLQHRGQDAAGIATANGSNFHMHKANGMVRDVFRTRNMRSLPARPVSARSVIRPPVPRRAKKKPSRST
jgi:glutamate synthase domain-containing protein 1